MAVNIVTGQRGKAHITSDDDRARNAEMFGSGKFVFNEFGGRLWANKVGPNDNNHIVISSGMCMNQGTQMGIELGDTTELFVENNSAGYQRFDLVVMRYSRDFEENTEQAELVVIKGDPAQQNAVIPYSKMKVGNILDADGQEDDMPLWVLRLNGTELQAPTADDCLYKLRSGYKPTNPDDPDPGQEVDPTGTFLITTETVDRLWGARLEDGDAEVYNG